MKIANENKTCSKTFEESLLEIIKKSEDKWYAATPFHTTTYWTFRANGSLYCVSKCDRKNGGETSYLISKEFEEAKYLYSGYSKIAALETIEKIVNGR